MSQINTDSTETSKIKVISIQVSPPKGKEESNEINLIVNHIRHHFSFSAFVGINRLYLLYSRRIIQLLGFILSAAFVILTIYFNSQKRAADNASYTVVKDTSAIEYILLVIFPILTSKNTLKKFFNDLSSFDTAFNLNNDIHVTAPNRRFWGWIVLSIAYIVLESLVILVYLPQFLDYTFTWSYLTTMAHNCEQLLFCTLLRMIMIRAIILKAYVVKTFQTDSETEKKFSVFEALASRAQLDISSLHKNYELLHRCSELLNSAMNLPMTLMLFCSGLSSTMLLKNLYRELQITNGNIYETRTVMGQCVSRCLKYTILVIIPCYFSSQTTGQVSHIRTILHDAMNGVQVSKAERRRIKAFFQLTRENEFSYALWGVIRLNMSLPLSYLSLCTTYLVIIIQFSKFID